MRFKDQWTRDSALVMRTVINVYIGGRTELRHLIDEYIRATQSVPPFGRLVQHHH